MDSPFHITQIHETQYIIKNHRYKQIIYKCFLSDFFFFLCTKSRLFEELEHRTEQNKRKHERTEEKEYSGKEENKSQAPGIPQDSRKKNESVK